MEPGRQLDAGRQWVSLLPRLSLSVLTSSVSRFACSRLSLISLRHSVSTSIVSLSCALPISVVKQRAREGCRQFEGVVTKSPVNCRLTDWLLHLRTFDRSEFMAILWLNSSSETKPLLSWSISAHKIFLSRAGTLSRVRDSSKALAPSSSSSELWPLEQNQQKASAQLLKPYFASMRAVTWSHVKVAFSWYWRTIAWTREVKAPGYWCMSCSTALYWSTEQTE
mmetsp:Transcript_103618/g.302414  ORF Transcript_103618/g.302414 Transcript_103618/m.302414 type:complete len:223 (+) Transcript_103618:113-781(+)